MPTSKSTRKIYQPAVARFATVPDNPNTQELTILRGLGGPVTNEENYFTVS